MSTDNVEGSSTEMPVTHVQDERPQGVKKQSI